MKNLIILIFKFLFAFGLIYWLIHTGKLNLSLLNDIITYPTRLLIALVGTFIVLLIVAFRYKLIIEHKSEIKIPFWNILKYNWIGMFFNAVLPGSVSGDLVKIFYIKKEDAKLTNTFLLGSILIDRVVGLFGIIIVLGFFSLINYTQLSMLSTDVKKILDFNLLLFLFVLLSLAMLFYFQKLPIIIANWFIKVPLLDKIIPKLIQVWQGLCGFKHRMLLLTFLSVIIQTGAIFLFWFMTAPYSDGEFSLFYAYSLVPVGLIALAVPIAPSGLGVGHYIFQGLFAYIGIKNGADLFNIYFVLVLSVNLLGAIPYFLNRNFNLKDLKKLEETN
jgi:glycosyltransferase 2 family protein